MEDPTLLKANFVYVKLELTIESTLSQRYVADSVVPSNISGNTKKSKLFHLRTQS
jgi:hypothetical protein